MRSRDNAANDGDISVANSLRASDITYYDKGTEHVAFEEGYQSTDNGSVMKDNFNMYLFANDSTGVGGAERTLVSTDAIDLTNIDTIKIDWKNTGSAVEENRSDVIVSSVKSGSRLVFDARAQKVNSFDRTVTDLDVSDLSGEYYLRIHARQLTATSTTESELFVYKIWAER
jgi:hypothetical protein